MNEQQSSEAIYNQIASQTSGNEVAPDDTNTTSGETMSSNERQSVISNLLKGTDSDGRGEVESNEPDLYREPVSEGETYVGSGDNLGNDPDSYTGQDTKKES